MRTRDITYDNWHLFLKDFTQLHHGQHVNVETIGQGSIGVQSRLCDLPLIGVVVADPGAGADEWFEVIAGELPDRHTTYSIAKPAKVRIAEEENGQAVALQVESSDGSTTMIRFQPSHENLPQGFTVGQ
jgi:hypothetical protein